MIDTLYGVVIGLGSPAGLIISTLASLTVMLLVVKAVKASRCESSLQDAPQPVLKAETSAPAQVEPEVEYRRAA